MKVFSWAVFCLLLSNTSSILLPRNNIVKSTYTNLVKRIQTSSLPPTLQPFGYDNCVVKYSPKVDSSRIGLMLRMCILYFFPLSIARASVPSNLVIKSDLSPIRGAITWLMLFILSAALHSAESAITKLSPWKVCYFVET